MCITEVNIQVRKSRCYFTEAGGTRRHLRLPSISVTLSLLSRCAVQKVWRLLCILLYHLMFLLWLNFFVCGCGVWWLLRVSRYFSAVNKNRLKQVAVQVVSAILDTSIGLELILVRRQSVRRWLSCKPVDCCYFLLGSRLLPQLQSITSFWPVSYYTGWW